MARYGLNILKSCSFRLATQHFGNTYYYEAPVPDTDTAALNALIDSVVALERAQHATSVSFVRARLWSQIGTPSQNQMLIDRVLTGLGSGSASGSIDKERAFLIRFKAGQDSKGRDVYLRKWFHLDVGALATNSITPGQIAQTSALNSTQKGALETFGNNLKSVPRTGGTWDLVSKNRSEEHTSELQSP